MTASYAPVLGGLQTVTGQLAQGLQALGHEVCVVTNRFPRTLTENETIGGVLVQRKLFSWPRRAQWSRPHLWLESAWSHTSTLQWLRDLVAEWQPDVINVHFPDGQIPYLLRLRDEYKGRLVVSLHGDEVMRFFGRIPPAKATDLIELLNSADAVTACSGDLLQHAIQLAPSISNKSVVIHNGVDVNRFVNASPYQHPRPYVLAIGRMTYKKGFDLLLQAWAHCADELRDFDLIIAGDGEEREALLRQVTHLDITEQIHFFGRAASEEVVSLMTGSQFVVVPSRDEPFGIVAVEALMAGKPLLATNVGGLPETAATVGDLPLAIELVSPNKESLAVGLRKFASETVAISAAAQKEIQNRFSEGAMLMRYAAILYPVGSVPMQSMTVEHAT